MKLQIVLLGAVVLAAALLTGCGGDGHPSTISMGTGSSSSGASSSSGSSSGGAAMMSLDTAQVLALAQVSSDTTQPMNVDDGALTLDDTSDTTQPITVNSN